MIVSLLVLSLFRELPMYCPCNLRITVTLSDYLLTIDTVFIIYLTNEIRKKQQIYSKFH